MCGMSMWCDRRKTGRPSCPRWQQWDVGKHRRRSWGYRLFADAQARRRVGGEATHHVGCVVDEAATVPRCEPEYCGCSYGVGQHIGEQTLSDRVGVCRGYWMRRTKRPNCLPKSTSVTSSFPE